MKVLATYNIKGGVGKTAAAVNLSHHCAAQGIATLIWDLDPQGAASFYFRIKADAKGRGKRLLRGKSALEDCIKGTDYDNLDMIPADFSFRNMDLILDGGRKPTQRLEKLLAPLAERYDYVFLDCPPSISLAMESAFRAADALLVPLVPTTLSLRALGQLLRFRERHMRGHPQVLPFFSMVDRRKRLHREVIEQLPARQPAVISVEIPYASEVEQMGTRRAPLAAFAGRSRAALAYRELWLSITRRLARPESAA